METIKSSAEISSLFSQGKRVHTPYLTLIVLPQQHGRPDQRDGRAAFIAGKRLGNAVWRNAAKRRMREICREVGGPWAGCDVIFLAKSSLTRASYSKVLTACREALKRADFIHPSGSENG